MLNLSRILINLIFLTSFLFHQSIYNIDVKGSKAFGSSDIISWTGISLGSKPFKGIEDSVKFKLARNFAARGYINSTFDVALIVIDSMKGTWVCSFHPRNPKLHDREGIVLDDNLFAGMIGEIHDQVRTLAGREQDVIERNR